ncbi:heterokaryon incompatibility protein-domain-containing protein [Podospora conica]|nr:heterokaryon incompatibility protein-domain-containing protein [Schizothecium conicum]
MSNEATGGDDSSSELYQYRPLTNTSDDIRLVKITGVQEHPEEESIVLELDIVHTRHDQAEPYLAISYAWGNPVRSHKILVNGAALHVPENTFQTLYTVYHVVQSSDTELYSRGEHPYLWIDAISINQCDLDEKNHQVPRMGEIYSQAVGTIGYIGRPPRGQSPAKAFRTLLWMGSDLGFMPPDKVHIGLVLAWFGVWGGDSNWVAEVGHIAEYADAYTDLFSNDWFRRLWVVQEMVLSRKTVCMYGYGSDHATMPFDTLVQLLVRSIDTQSSQHKFREDILGASTYKASTDAPVPERWNSEAQVVAWYKLRAALDRSQSEGLGILELLECTRFGKATDLRDRVYSVMGLMQLRDRLAIRVDYSADYTPASLFLDIAVHNLSSPDCHELFLSAGLRPKRNFLELPSWVPDWSAPTMSPMLMPDSFNASANLSDPLTLLGCGRKISARGTLVGAITLLTPSLASSDNLLVPGLPSLLNYANQLCHRLRKSDIETESHAADTYPFNNEPWTDVIWRTSCMDDLSRVDRHAAFDPDDISEVGFSWVEEHSEQRRRILGITGGRGFIGSFPESARAGDVVAVLIGGKLPVVLRPMEGEEEGFQLVGTCYVHGIMYGEWVTHATGAAGGERGGSGGLQEFVIQ